MIFTADSRAESCIHFYTSVTGNFLLEREGKPHGKQAVKGAVCPSLQARSVLFSDVNRQFRRENTDFSSQLSMDWSQPPSWIWFKALLCYCVNIGHYRSSLAV